MIDIHLHVCEKYEDWNPTVHEVVINKNPLFIKYYKEKTNQDDISESKLWQFYIDLVNPSNLLSYF